MLEQFLSLKHRFIVHRCERGLEHRRQVKTQEVMAMSQNKNGSIFCHDQSFVSVSVPSRAAKGFPEQCVNSGMTCHPSLNDFVIGFSVKSITLCQFRLDMSLPSLIDCFQRTLFSPKSLNSFFVDSSSLERQRGE